MRILGLDLSLRSTGYVLLDEDQVVWFGTVGSDTLREAERLSMFDRWIRDGLAEHGPDEVAVEGYAYSKRPDETRAFGAGELGGVIKLAIHQAGLPLQIIASNTWKKVVCGNGRLDKRRASVEISKRYGVEFAKEDTLDAWAIAMCRRRQLLGLDKPEPKVRKRKLPVGLPLLEGVEA